MDTCRNVACVSWGMKFTLVFAAFINRGPPYLILEYAVYGSLKDFLKHCEQAVLSLNHVPQIVRSRTRSRRLESHSSVSSAYPLLVEPSPHNDSAFSPTTFQFPTPFLSTQDSGFCEDSEDTLSAYAPGMSLPLAHTLSPISHDYINTKGLIFMEDIPNFALQIACGLEHLENMQVTKKREESLLAFITNVIVLMFFTVW